MTSGGSEHPQQHRKRSTMKKSVTAFAVLVFIAICCGNSSAADSMQNSGTHETGSAPGEKTTVTQNPLTPKGNSPYKRSGRTWLNPQPEPPLPGSVLWLNPQPEPPLPGSVLWLNPQPEPPLPGSLLWLNPQPEPPKPPEPTLIK
jgi:hypothetical protein